MADTDLADEYRRDEAIRWAALISLNNEVKTAPTAFSRAEALDELHEAINAAEPALRDCYEGAWALLASNP